MTPEESTNHHSHVLNLDYDGRSSWIGRRCLEAACYRDSQEVVTGAQQEKLLLNPGEVAVESSRAREG